MMVRFAFRMQLVLLLLGLAAGCSTTSSPAVHFYALEAVAEGTGAGPRQTGSAPSIGIGRVSLPAYLQRPHIVVRTQSNQMRIEEYHRWAGSLEDDIQRVLIENLMRLTGTERIARLPWAGDFQPDVTLRMEVLRFEAVEGPAATLMASVTLVRRGIPNASETWSVNLSTPSKSDRYADLAEAQSRLLAELSRDIADRIYRH